MITGEQVKAARKQLGWSQMKLAWEANIDPSIIGKFEIGKKPPSVLSLQTIKRALEYAGVDFHEGEPPRLKAGGDQ
jgi:ribosome-binding protein aMBF1 (putative translation factor)